MAERDVRDDLSLQDIEGDDWGDPETGQTGLVGNVLRYRRLPLRELGTEELRELILQQVSLDVLVPRALPILEDDPRAEGVFFPGDLLDALLQADAQFWAAHPELAGGVEGVVDELDDDPDDVVVDLSDSIAAFRASAGRPAPS